MNLDFDLLSAEEIDCRIGTVKYPKDGKPGGVSLLLYKDARCDMTRLDKTVGPMNWQREHSRENANCTVSIWDSEKGVWVSKEDVGVASKTEAEKGLASDSFKRACVNWGIGRELYTAPFIWISGDPEKLKYERFRVKAIGYDKKSRSINALTVVDKNAKVVFQLGKIEEIEPDTPDAVDETVDKKVDKTETVIPHSAPVDASIKKVDKVPDIKSKNPVREYIANEMSFMKQMFGISDTAQMTKKFMEMRQSLIEAKLIEDIPSDKQTMDQAKQMIEAIYANFAPSGDKAS